MGKLRLLLAEDEENVAKFMELELIHEGYDVTVVYDGKAAISVFQEGQWDVILLDWMLPFLDGLEVCRRIRKTSSVPVIIITARDYLGDKIVGLDTGADDYITKPFEIEELFARIRAVIRRHNPPEKHEELLQIEDLEMRPLSRTVIRNGELIELTPREFDLLYFLMKNKGFVLTRDRLLSEVWGFDFDVGTNIVDVYIRYLRNKIDHDFSVKLIHTVRGIGYVLRSKMY